MQSAVALLFVGLSALSCTPGASDHAAIAPEVAASASETSVPAASLSPPAASAAALPGGVSALVAQSPTSGAHAVVGYVTYLYRCPACPPGAMCKPCMGDNLVLSDAPKPLADYSAMGPGDVIVFADRAALEPLTLGGHYRMNVQVEPRKTTSQSIHDLRLLGATLLP